MARPTKNREIQVQRPGLKPRATDLLRQRIGLVQHALDWIRGWPLQQGENFRVIESALRADHRRVKLRSQHMAFPRKQELHVLRQPVHI